MSIMDEALRAAAAECDAKDARIRELEAALGKCLEYIDLDNETPIFVCDAWDLLKGTVAETPEAMHARIRELENAVRWACGEIGDFPGEDTSKGRYHWRRELRLRAGVPFVPPSETITDGHATSCTVHRSPTICDCGKGFSDQSKAES